MPSLAEPHAMVKVRLAYHARPGPMLSQLVLINGEDTGIPAPPDLGSGEITRAIPVRPIATRWDLHAEFFHTITVAQTQTTYTTESYPCGRIGNSTSYCTRSIPHTRTVWVTQHVRDAYCEQAAGQAPQVGAVYLLQYDFFAHGHCTLACFRQLPQADGSFLNAPCEPPPPS
jgi:hypothetical protein